MIYLHSYKFENSYYHDFIENGIYYSITIYIRSTTIEYYIIDNYNSINFSEPFEYTLPEQLIIKTHIYNRWQDLEDSKFRIALNNI